MTFHIFENTRRTQTNISPAVYFSIILEWIYSVYGCVWRQFVRRCNKSASHWSGDGVSDFYRSAKNPLQALSVCVDWSIQFDWPFCSLVIWSTPCYRSVSGRQFVLIVDLLLYKCALKRARTHACGWYVCVCVFSISAQLFAFGSLQIIVLFLQHHNNKTIFVFFSV